MACPTPLRYRSGPSPCAPSLLYFNINNSAISTIYSVSFGVYSAGGCPAGHAALAGAVCPSVLSSRLFSSDRSLLEKRWSPSKLYASVFISSVLPLRHFCPRWTTLASEMDTLSKYQVSWTLDIATTPSKLFLKTN